MTNAIINQIKECNSMKVETNKLLNRSLWVFSDSDDTSDEDRVFGYSNFNEHFIHYGHLLSHNFSLRINDYETLLDKRFIILNYHNYDSVFVCFEDEQDFEIVKVALKKFQQNLIDRENLMRKTSQERQLYAEKLLYEQLKIKYEGTNFTAIKKE